MVCKNLLSSLFCFIFILNAFSQLPPSIQWQKCYGGSLTDGAQDLQQTFDGGYIIAGYTNSTNGDVNLNHGGYDCWVLKLDQFGAIIWKKTFGGSADDRAYSIQQTNDGGYVMAGITRSNNSGDVGPNYGSDDYWVVKMNNIGDITWQKTLGGSQADIVSCVRQTSDGGYILAGESNSINGDITGNHGSADYWIVKLDDTGNLVWQKAFGGTAIDRAKGIQQTFDGGYIVTGYSNSSDGDVLGGWVGGDIFWTVKLNSTGDITWQKTYGSRIVSEESFSVQQTVDSGYIVAGYSTINGGDVTGNHGSYDYWVIKLDSLGNLTWQKSLGGSNFETALSVQQTIDEGYIVAGYTASIDGDVTGNHGGNDFWVVKLSSLGILKWQKCLGGINNDNALALRQTVDSGFIVAGFTGSNNNGDVGPNHGGNDIWIVRLGSETTIPVTFNRLYANLHDKSVLCKWQTIQEQNSRYFIIERSIDAVTYISVGKINAAGNSSLPIMYSFIDDDIFALGYEQLYYRLKMIDIDSTFKYSNIAQVKMKFTTNLNIRPNPINDQLNISFISTASDRAVINIIEYSGRKVYEKNILIKKGNNSFTINASALAAGKYIALIISNKSNYTIQFIKD